MSTIKSIPEAEREKLRRLVRRWRYEFQVAVPSDRAIDRLVDKIRKPAAK